ncbi:hypothetical protein DBR32_07330 [Taibaiella sp. KBW10]|uniref:BlaI/MecI/CopY family transcriptional regulator n=1 Tax=Taibaiella sp. KBW10 TaxID=2153357 RepID=UPI000F595D0C|nr:BlaI/MecI/CopY family transcriptional regulator [Taibaiella sp. KBW10]RQO31750.1 hypothetical protein DBR32_07330 [Taibaiella sp. KBW10]
MSDFKNLTKAEEQVMQALWEIEAGTTHQILDFFEVPKPHYNTVSTVLKILVDKNFVSFKQVGKTNIYHPLVPKTDYSKDSIMQVVRNYFGGSFTRMFSAFVSEDKLSLKDMEQIQKELDKHKK